MTVDASGLLLISTRKQPQCEEEPSDNVQSLLLSSPDSSKQLRIAFVHTKEVLFVQLLPGQICSTVATAAALWLLHMLLFLLGPWPNWLQDRADGAGVQLSPWCSQQLLQLLPVLLLPLHHLALVQPSLTRLLLSVGLPAVHLPQQLQQHIADKLHALQQLLPAWLPIAVPQQLQGHRQQLLGPSCFLFYRGCLVYSSVRPWAAQRLWGLAHALGLHCRTAHHPPELLVQDAFVNLAAAHALGGGSSRSRDGAASGAASRAPACSSSSSAVVLKTCDSGCARLSGAPSFFQGIQQCEFAEWAWPAAWPLQQPVQSLQEQLQQELQAFESAASSRTAVADRGGRNDAVHMVQPCSIIAACLGPYTLMLLADRQPAEATRQATTAVLQPAKSTTTLFSVQKLAGAAEFSNVTAAAAAGGGGNGFGSCSQHACHGTVMGAAMECLHQMLVGGDGDALRQQLELSVLPPFVAQACQSRVSSAVRQQQQQQQQQQTGLQQQLLQQSCELAMPVQLPRLHIASAEATGSLGFRVATAAAIGGADSGTDASFPCNKSPRKLRRLCNLLICGGGGGTADAPHLSESCLDKHAEAAAAHSTSCGIAVANCNSVQESSTPNSVFAVAAASAAAAAKCSSHSAVLSQPGTPVAAARTKHGSAGSSSSSSSQVRALQFLLGKVTGQAGQRRGSSRLGSTTPSSTTPSSTTPSSTTPSSTNPLSRLLGGSCQHRFAGKARSNSSSVTSTEAVYSNQLYATFGSENAAAAGHNLRSHIEFRRTSCSGSVCGHVHKERGSSSVAGMHSQGNLQGPSEALTADQHACSNCGGSCCGTVTAQLCVHWQHRTFTVAESPAVAVAAAAKAATCMPHRQHISNAGVKCASSSRSSKRVLDAAAALLPHVLSKTQPAATGSVDILLQQQLMALRPTGSNVAAAGARRSRQAALLPSWSLAQLERYGAAAGDGAGSAVLDASPEPWRVQGTDADLNMLLTQLHCVQLHAKQ